MSVCVSSRGESTPKTKENEEEGEVRKSTPSSSYLPVWGGGVDLFWRVLLCALSFLSDDDDDDACVFFNALLLFVRKKSIDFDDGKEEEEDFFRFGVVAKEKRWCARPAQQKRHRRRRAATSRALMAHAVTMPSGLPPTPTHMSVRAL